MKEWAKLLLIILLFAGWGVPRCATAQDTPDVALWLARSCVGESGWDTHKTGECSAIIHVYKKRSQITGWLIYKVARKYSAAIKARQGRPNPWVMYLDRLGTKPKKWPSQAKWDTHRAHWLEILAWVDTFMANPTPDPLPNADHYGGSVDAHRARRMGWWKLDTPQFKNKFWSITDPKRKGKENVNHD